MIKIARFLKAWNTGCAYFTGVKSTGFSAIFIGKKYRRSRKKIGFSRVSHLQIRSVRCLDHRNFIVYRVHVSHETFVCTRARFSRASSPFLILVIGRFHRQSRRVSVARSARCDVVQGQGHMVTGGRGGHMSYRYISTTSHDPLLPPSRHHRRRSARSPPPPLSTVYVYIYVTTKYERKRERENDRHMCAHVVWPCVAVSWIFRVTQYGNTTMMVTL